MQRQLGEALAHAAAEHGVGDGVARTRGVERLDDVGWNVDPASVDGDEEIVDRQAGARTGPVAAQFAGDDAFGARHPEHAVFGLEPAGADAHVRDHQHQEAGGDHDRHERAHDGAQARPGEAS